MAKRTFACRTFASRTFKSGNWAGVGMDVSPHEVQQQHVASTGLAFGRMYQPGAASSKTFSSGAVAGNVQE